jgi:hypothetical protein
VGPLFAGLAADPLAAQDWLDLFTRRTRPSQVYTAERLAAWTARPLEPEGAASG